MSQEARDKLCGALVFQPNGTTNRGDLENASVTSTYLIALLTYLVFERGWIIEVLYVKDGHHDDGPHGHFGGFAVDVWPLDSLHEGDWTDETEPRFQRFLEDCASAPSLHQIGLGGGADIAVNVIAAGPTYFPDSNQDHVHLGATDGTF